MLANLYNLDEANRKCEMNHMHRPTVLTDFTMGPCKSRLTCATVSTVMVVTRTAILTGCFCAGRVCKGENINTFFISYRGTGTTSFKTCKQIQSIGKINVTTLQKI